MYQLHNFVNNSAPYINSEHLNEMDLGIASGCTYVGTCSTAAGTSAKTLTISGFESSRLTGQTDVPFVLYVLFSNGSTSSTMTISINSGTARNVRYRNSTALGSTVLNIAANDVVAFVYYSGIFYLLGAITKPLSEEIKSIILSVAYGGTGRTTLTSNAVLAGNGTSAIKMISSASGALYATSANGTPAFGTLPVAQGGTGATAAAAARANLGVPTVYSGTGTPSSSTGSNGDLYFKYSS